MSKADFMQNQRQSSFSSTIWLASETNTNTLVVSDWWSDFSSFYDEKPKQNQNQSTCVISFDKHLKTALLFF